MIKFREKPSSDQDLIGEVVDHLKKDGQSINTIEESEADDISRMNSKSLVLYSFKRVTNGYYQIQVMDKTAGRYIQKLIEDILRFRITDIDSQNRIITAETKYLGMALDAIDVLERKYNLSIVIRGNDKI
jgi:hypothetical protein